MDCQFISKYGKFVTSQTASFSREDINTSQGGTSSGLLLQFRLLICPECLWCISNHRTEGRGQGKYLVQLCWSGVTCDACVTWCHVVSRGVTCDALPQIPWRRSPRKAAKKAPKILWKINTSEWGLYYSIVVLFSN